MNFKFASIGIAAFLLISCSSPLPLFCAQPVAPETWTLTFSSEISQLNQNGFGITVKSSGQADLQADEGGNFKGIGKVSAVITTVMPPTPGISFTPATGQGTFTVTGHRDLGNLVFGFGRNIIPCKGTLTITSPAGSETSIVDHEYDTAVPAPTETTIIERKEGATTTVQLGIQESTSGLSGMATFKLTGGSNVVPGPLPIEGIFPKIPNMWTLEHEVDLNTIVGGNVFQGTYKISGRGKVEFPLPLGDGPAKGEGPLSATFNSKWTKPQPHQGTATADGLMTLDGEIRNNTLIFRPRTKLGDVKSQEGPPQVNYGATFGAGVTWVDWVESVSIPVKNGAEHKIDLSHSIDISKTTGHVTWRLRGKKIEKWLVTVDQWPLMVFGAFKGKSQTRAGLKVHWRRTIELEITDDEYKSGSGKNKLVELTSYSEPPGVYETKPVASSTVGTGTDIDYERWDQVKNAKKFNPKFMTPEDAKLKEKWEKISQQKTPFTFPESYPVPGTKTGNQVTLEMPTPCGFVVAYHTKPTVNASATKKKLMQETINEDRYTVNGNLTVSLQDGWIKTRQFSTSFQGNLGWTESSSGSNVGNVETITVVRLKE
jgi:hypothetical protein